MSLDTQITRVSQGTKDTLKAILNKLGADVADELIDQYPSLAAALEMSVPVVGSYIVHPYGAINYPIPKGTLLYLTQSDGRYVGYRATTPPEASAYYIGIAQETLTGDADDPVAIIAQVDNTAIYNAISAAEANAKNASRPADWTPSAEDVGADPSGSAAAVGEALNTHTGDTVKHITADERTKWNDNTTNLTTHDNNTTKHITAEERATWNAKQAALSFDTEPTAGSANPVTSGGVRTYIDALIGDIDAALDAINGEVI